MDSDRLVIGIGCNVGSAPPVPSSGQQNGRPSTCLANHNDDINGDVSPSDEGISVHHMLAKEIYQSIEKWLQTGHNDTPRKIVQEFESMMDFRPQRLRQTYVESNAEISAHGDSDLARNKQESNSETKSDTSPSDLDVIPLRINVDGTLEVRLIFLCMDLLRIPWKCFMIGSIHQDGRGPHSDC